MINTLITNHIINTAINNITDKIYCNFNQLPSFKIGDRFKYIDFIGFNSIQKKTFHDVTITAIYANGKEFTFDYKSNTTTFIDGTFKTSSNDKNRSIYHTITLIISYK